jgi:serine/threonine protein kinase
LLDRIAPLNDLTQFVRIARDLSRGLVFLHKNNLVHRDLKLDNCGLDHQQQAKIFDLGSVTSEPADVLGTIFTRAPELFAMGAQCDNSSDVWALGATLFALRTGDYPFVTKSEIEERRLVNRQLREGAISEEDARKQKQEIDIKVRDRVTRANAEPELIERVHGTLRGRPKDILLSMLKFNINDREKIETIEQAWSSLAREFAGLGKQPPIRRSKWDQIKRHLKSVEQDEMQLTVKQMDRIISDYENEKPTDAELAQSIKKVKEKLSA